MRTSNSPSLPCSIFWMPCPCKCAFLTGTSSLAPPEIFNADELKTAPFWQILSNWRAVHAVKKKEPGECPCLACCTYRCSCKLQSLVISKGRSPRCFKIAKGLPVRHVFHGKVPMTLNFLAKWLRHGLLNWTCLPCWVYLLVDKGSPWQYFLVPQVAKMNSTPAATWKDFFIGFNQTTARRIHTHFALCRKIIMAVARETHGCATRGPTVPAELVSFLLTGLHTNGNGLWCPASWKPLLTLMVSVVLAVTSAATGGKKQRMKGPWGIRAPSGMQEETGRFSEA